MEHYRLERFESSRPAQHMNDTGHNIEVENLMKDVTSFKGLDTHETLFVCHENIGIRINWEFMFSMKNLGAL